MRHNPTYGIMGGLMAEDGDVRFRIAEALEWRHLDVIARGSEEGFGPAMADHRAGVLEEAVGVLDPRHRVDDPVRPVIVVIRQPFDLIAIKDRVGLEKRDIPLDLVAARVGFGFGEAAGVDHARAGFAFSDLGTDLTGLPIGHPQRRLETPGDTLRPEEQHVDACVGLAGVPEWPRDPAFEAARAPGLHPGADAVFQIGDDRLGDPRMDIDTRALLFPFHFQTS